MDHEMTVYRTDLCTEEMLSNRKDSEMLIDGGGNKIDPENYDGPIYKLTPVTRDEAPKTNFLDTESCTECDWNENMPKICKIMKFYMMPVMRSCCPDCGGSTALIVGRFSIRKVMTGWWVFKTSHDEYYDFEPRVKK